MRVWSERASEEAALLNPAFTALLVGGGAQGFVREVGEGMPLTLAFVLLPIALHKPTRDALPGTVATSFAAWLEAHGDVRLGFPDRASRLAPLVREALGFGARHGHFTVSGQLQIVPVSGGERTARRLLVHQTDDVKSCVAAATFAGRWLGRAGNPLTSMALLGVCP